MILKFQNQIEKNRTMIRNKLKIKIFFSVTFYQVKISFLNQIIKLILRKMHQSAINCIETLEISQLSLKIKENSRKITNRTVNFK
jgi:hypothetical protein